MMTPIAGVTDTQCIVTVLREENIDMMTPIAGGNRYTVYCHCVKRGKYRYDDFYVRGGKGYILYSSLC